MQPSFYMLFFCLLLPSPVRARRQWTVSRGRDEKGVTHEKPPKWNHQHPGKTLEKRNYFYPLLVKVPGKAVLLQHSKTAVEETELPNPLAFVTCQLHFPTALTKASAGTWCWAPHKKPKKPKKTPNHRGLLRFCGWYNISAADAASSPWCAVKELLGHYGPAASQADTGCGAGVVSAQTWLKPKKGSQVVDYELHKGNYQRCKPNLV